MVLVDLDWRRRGIARGLIERCTRDLAAAGLIPVLDATPAGRTVYAGMDFRDVLGLQRWQRAARAADADTTLVPGLRPLRRDDLAAVAALDAQAFGAPRAWLLESLAARSAGFAAVTDRDGRITGAVLGRQGRNATQVGPIVAADEATAITLLRHAAARIAGPIFIDALDQHGALAAGDRARRLHEAAALYAHGVAHRRDSRRSGALLRRRRARTRIGVTHGPGDRTTFPPSRSRCFAAARSFRRICSRSTRSASSMRAASVRSPAITSMRARAASPSACTRPSSPSASVGLYEPVLRLAPRDRGGVDRPAAGDDRRPRRPHRAGVPRGAASRAALGYHAGLLSLAAMKGATEDELIAHCRAVADVMPLVGFYLQPAVGGLRAVGATSGRASPPSRTSSRSRSRRSTATGRST